MCRDREMKMQSVAFAAVALVHTMVQIYQYPLSEPTLTTQPGSTVAPCDVSFNPQPL
jgi:hypothetical protein